MEFKKKDLIDYLILEIDDLEPQDECYFSYYNKLLDIIEDNRQKSLKELVNNFKEFLIIKYNKIVQLIKHYYNKIYIEEEDEDEDEDEVVYDEDEDEDEDEVVYDDELITKDIEETEDDDKIDYRIEFINTIKECDLDIINQFIEDNKFDISKEILEKRLKRHIIPITKKNRIK